MVNRNEQSVKVYLDGEYIGAWRFTGTQSDATIVAADPNVPRHGFTSKNADVEFTDGQRWEYICRSEEGSARSSGGAGLQPRLQLLQLIGRMDG